VTAGALRAERLRTEHRAEADADDTGTPDHEACDALNRRRR
jgi:hypothetical protein